MSTDLRQALRLLLKNPGFSALVILVLATGCGGGSHTMRVTLTDDGCTYEGDTTPAPGPFNIEVENKYLPRLSEEPAISRGLLSGDTTLDFIPKTDERGQPVARADSVPANAEIIGVPPINTQRLLNQAQGAIPNAQDALVKFSATVSRFDKVISFSAN